MKTCDWCGQAATTFVTVNGRNLDVCRARAQRVKADQEEQAATRRRRSAGAQRRIKAHRESKRLIDLAAPSAITEG